MANKSNVDITVIDKETGEEVIGSKAVTNVWNIFFRIVAVFAASGLSVIGAGAIAGVDTITAVTVAGLTAVAAVVEKLARAFMDDGKLSLDEINAAFSAVDKGAKTVADVEVEERQAADKKTKVVPAKEDDPNYN